MRNTRWIEYLKKKRDTAAKGSRRLVVVRHDPPSLPKPIVHDADTWLREHSSDVSIPSSWPEPWQFSSHYIGINVSYRYREVNVGLIKTDDPQSGESDLPEVRTPQPDWQGGDLWICFWLVHLRKLRRCLCQIPLWRVDRIKPLSGICTNFNIEMNNGR